MNSVRKIIDELRKVAPQFSTTDGREKKNFLQKLSSIKLFSADDLVAYHDCLLLLAAYPQSKTLYESALKELQRVAAISKQISAGENEKEVAKLAISGIEGTYLIAAFSFDLCEWICKAFPSHVQLYGCYADVDSQLKIMKALLPAIVHTELEREFTGIEKWLSANKGDEVNYQLELFLKLFHNINNLATRDYLFASLKVFIQVDIGNQLWSRTFNCGISSKIFYHTTELINKVDLLKTVNKAVAEPLEINDAQKQHLIKSARCQLFTLFRETDPVTYCNYRETQFYELERGYSIAIFFMEKQRCVFPDALASYIIYKNNIPISYGDVLIFMNHARLAFNIYGPYRGCESTYIYFNVMRLFSQRFNVECFEVEPYQIGHKNDEAIQSGSFWFYYKFGFRPVNHRQKNIAEKEYKKIKADKKYRTTAVTLKQLAKSSLQLSLVNADVNDINAPAVSKAIGEMISNKFNGDYNKALTNSRKLLSDFLKPVVELDDVEQQVMDNFSLLLNSINDLKQWSEADKQTFKEIIKAKLSGQEYNYCMLVQKHERLRASLINLLKTG
ncbi:MAG: hypothetical protein ABI723_05985 [Bacteroidia bacterium]